MKPEKSADKVDIEQHDDHVKGEPGSSDVYASNKRVQIAKLCGREIMFADSEPQEWDWKKKLDEDTHKVIGKLYCIVGKTETGKSFWIRNFLYEARNLFSLVVVMSHTKFNGFYQQFLPNFLIIDHFSPEICEALMELQKSRWGERGHNNNICLILDDVASEKLQHQYFAQRIAMEGRHYGITTLVSNLTLVKLIFTLIL